MNLVYLYRSNIQLRVEFQALVMTIEQDVRSRLRPFIGRATSFHMTQEMKQVVDDCINSYTDQLLQFDQEMVIKALNTPR